MEKLLKEIEKYLVIIGVLFFAIFILPGFPSPYHVPKEIFALTIISLALICAGVRSILKGEIKYSAGKFDLGVILIMLAYLAGSIIRTPNKMEAFFYPGTTTFVVIAALFYLIINQFPKRSKNIFLSALFGSGILLSVSILFSQLGIFAKVPQLPSFMKDANFNALGGYLQSVVYLLALLPIGIAGIIKEKDAVKKAFFGVASAVLIFGIVIAGVNMLPGKSQSPILPTMQTSWEVLIETIKNTPLFGVGPANYLTAFDLYRPITYNQTALWQVRFSSATNYYFTLMTELGFIGIAALVMFFIELYKKLLADYKNKIWEEISVALLIVALAIIPATPGLLFLLMTLLAIFSGSEEKSTVIATNKVPSIIVVTPVFMAIAALGFFGTKAVLAETYYEKSLKALSINEATNTYNYMIKAETLNPYVDRYHASLAQVEMALASSLANRKDISDADRSTITTLVQQAISEGKATVNLNSTRSNNWEILGQIYRGIMSFAEGSDQFAIQTYNQAIQFDPYNPDLRISLGGVYYALGQFDQAINAFQLAATAKSDYANAYYNLSAAYAANKNYDSAINQMNTVLSLVSKDSDDYKTAQAALEELKKQKPSSAKSTEGQGQLSTPETVQSSNIQPLINLPEEATPPANSNE